jgi:hypothetical protein
MCAAAVLCGDGVGQVGVELRDGDRVLVWDGGKRRWERVATHVEWVRMDEDRSSICTWRFTRCFSAWDAEVAEVAGAVFQVLFHVIGWLVGSDVIAISLTDQAPSNPRPWPSVFR